LPLFAVAIELASNLKGGAAAQRIGGGTESA
jgi:hypothetical protein